MVVKSDNAHLATIAQNTNSALSKDTDSVLTYPRGTIGVTLTASDIVYSGQGKLVKVIVSSVSATPTLKLWDALTASGTALLETITLTAGMQIDIPYDRFVNGCYATITGTATIRVYIDNTPA